jgi:PAS domain S-box-containing protein
VTKLGGAVTDRRAAVSESEATMLAAVFASVADAVVTTDPAARILRVNPAAEQLFGVSPDHARGLDVVDTLVDPADRDRARDWVRRLATGERFPPGMLARLRKADGTCFSGELALAPVFGGDGEILGLVGMARDVTARLAAEADAETLRAVVAAAAEAIIGLDEHGNVTSFSPSAERLYGWEAEEILGRPADILAAEHRRPHVEALRATLRAGDSIRRETTARRRDGSHVEVELSARPILGPGGRFRGGALTVLDVSERSRVQRTLDRIVEHAPNAIAVKDLEGHYLLYNQLGAVALGLDPGEIIGRRDPELFGAEQAEYLIEQDRRVIAANAPLTFQDEITARDGSVHSYLTTKFPLPDAGGRVEAVGLIAADVTEIRRAESARAQLAALVQAAPDAIIARDREGRIATWNPGAEAMFGLSAEQAVGRTYADLIVPEEERERFHELLEEIQSGRTVTVRSPRMRADGSRFPAQISVAPLTLLDGSWQGTLAMIRDITDLVDAELELRERADLLERSNADLERFAYTASHDLQEPLHSIRLSAGAVIEAAADRLDDEERELMTHIDTSAGRLSGQVRGLMEVARVALGGDSAERVPVEVAVRDAVDALRAAIAATGAEVDIRCPLPAVDLPRTVLSLVIQNLIGNAIKYHRHDTPPRIVVSGAAGDGYVEVRVADNGVGLAEADLSAIFDLFARGRTGVPGTGMGLAVSRRMLERHGGSLRGSSAGPGCGSKFTVRLPLGGD